MCVMEVEVEVDSWKGRGVFVVVINSGLFVSVSRVASTGRLAKFAVTVKATRITPSTQRQTTRAPGGHEHMHIESTCITQLPSSPLDCKR